MNINKSRFLQIYIRTHIRIHIYVCIESINVGSQVTESTARCSYAALSAQNVKCAFKLNSLMNSRQRLATDHTGPNWTEPELNWTEAAQVGWRCCPMRPSRFYQIKNYMYFCEIPLPERQLSSPWLSVEERDLAESTACWGIKKAAWFNLNKIQYTYN